ncbi:extracellular solute-binding protein [Occultella glacieicola]|uniref:Extracellular solute-binding protein n=1 Tax=Occultella glacieicola TaxID=2518684 RepID=A0ABY2DYC0_9MICO|nr:extracellular solute-binding protein [Occultella glacieicola]TDE88829.1 extracellular solute-binding protein [Occultella glacieicola]
MRTSNELIALGRLGRPSRRNVLQLGGLGLGGGLLAACSGPTVGGPDDGASETSAGVDWASIEPADEITFMALPWGGDVEVALLEEFTEATGIAVNAVSGGGSYEELAQNFRASLGTSEQPDVAQASDVFWFQYLLTGSTMAVDDLLAYLEVDVDDFQGALYDDYEFDGHHWAVPYGRSTPMFYYNTDLWEAAGLPDRGPETWTEFQEWSPQLASVVPAGGAPMGWAAPGPSGTAWIAQNVLWAHGARYSNEWEWTLDSEEALWVGNFYRDAFNGPDAWSKVGVDLAAEFTSGLYGSILGSTGGITSYRELLPSLGVAFMPGGTVPADAPRVPTGGNGLAISATTPEKQLAGGMLLQHLTTPENSARFSIGTGYVPTRGAALETDTMKAGIEEVPDRQIPIDQLAITQVQDYARALLPGGDLLITEHFERIILSGENAEDVFPSLTSEFQRAFEQNVEPYL